MTRTTRSLALRRESLTELTVPDLSLVAGGAAATGPIRTCVVTDCVTRISDAASCNPTCGHTGCCPTTDDAC